MNTDMLNNLKTVVINHANKNGINLSAEFGTPEEFRQWLISFAFSALTTKGGLSTDQAFDAIFGDGAYKALADDVWEKLNNK